MFLMINLILFCIGVLVAFIGSVIYIVIKIAECIFFHSKLKKDRIRREVDLQTQEQQKQKQEEIPESETYIFTQLETWSKEHLFLKNQLKEYERKANITFDVKEREKLNKKIIQMYKQLGTAEKNILKTCEKYHLDSVEYF